MSQPLNPYESPTEVNEATAEEQDALQRRHRLRSWLVAPAVAFIVLGLLQATAALALAVGSSPALVQTPDLGWIPLVSLLDGIFMISVAVAGYRMLQLRSAGFVQTIAFLCCIPLVTPFLVIGLPFGLWATIVMSRSSNHGVFFENEKMLTREGR